jgi:hypothetical protein
VLSDHVAGEARLRKTRFDSGEKLQQGLTSKLMRQYTTFSLQNAGRCSSAG